MVFVFSYPSLNQRITDLTKLYPSHWEFSQKTVWCDVFYNLEPIAASFPDIFVFVFSNPSLQCDVFYNLEPPPLSRR